MDELMRRLMTLAFVFAVLPAMGCQCVPVSERWHDHVDSVADSEAHFDECYHPIFDVTRWGRWDGPQRCRNCR